MLLLARLWELELHHMKLWKCWKTELKGILSSWKSFRIVFSKLKDWNKVIIVQPGQFKKSFVHWERGLTAQKFQNCLLKKQSTTESEKYGRPPRVAMSDQKWGGSESETRRSICLSRKKGRHIISKQKSVAWAQQRDYTGFSRHEEWDPLLYIQSIPQRKCLSFFIFSFDTCTKPWEGKIVTRRNLLSFV